MNHEHESAAIEQEVIERRMDWAIGEVVGDERAPDVVLAVMARRAAALVESRQARVTGRGGPLLNAAVLVLGLVVVAWVMFASRGVDEAGAPTGQDPQFVVVTTMAQIGELPGDARAVELNDLGDEGFVALAKQCPRLERLRVRGRGPDLRSFAALGEGGYNQLVEADFTGCGAVQDVFVAKLIEAKTMTRIALGGTAVTAAVVPFLEMTPQLRAVDFGEARWLTLEMAEQLLMGGKRVRVQRPGDVTFVTQLAELTARYAGILDRPFYCQATTLAELRALPQNLAYLALRGLGDRATALLVGRERLRGVAYIGDDGGDLSRDSMAILSEMTQLEEVCIQVPHWDGSGLELLGGLRNLRKLTLGNLPARPMQWIGNLASLRELVHYSPIDAGVLEALATCRELEVLELPAALGGDAQLARVGELSNLRRLRLPGRECGPQTLAAIGKLSRLESLDLSCPASSDARHVMPRLSPLGQLRSLASLDLQSAQLARDDLLSLPTSLRGLKLVWCSGLDATAGPALRDRFPGLLTLELYKPEWLDDDALRAILAAPSLEHLTIIDSFATTPVVLPAILAAKNLRHLDARRSTFLDDAAVETLRRERPDLQVVRKVW